MDNQTKKILKGTNNFAYIDGANLHNGIAGFGWTLDYARFRVWLSEKYGVKNAYIFIGLIPRYKELYKYLQECGFTLIFKEVVYDGDGKPKGNCDADLVLQATRDAYENKFNMAIIISSDGDYAGLVKFLKARGKLRVILSPHAKEKCSILLKRTDAPIAYLNDQRLILQTQKEKAPDADGTA
ncbi:NYN domain-containing protein [Patescibacteria group bacterium]|nr:NYN domain-containing protein [Patescibacteria group bacterium]MBU4579603.1 NYN domain-containing protein [Patescibacteria group bacterium]